MIMTAVVLTEQSMMATIEVENQAHAIQHVEMAIKLEVSYEMTETPMEQLDVLMIDLEQ